jgi:hypothetical protein
VEGTKEANRRIKQRKDVSPSNVGSWVRGGGRIEEDTGTKIDGVGGRSSEAMPEKPPAARWVRWRGIIRVTAKEMTAGAAIRSTSGGREKGLGQVNLDEVPAGAKSAGRAIGDKEQPIGRSSDCVKQRGTSGWGG